MGSTTIPEFVTLNFDRQKKATKFRAASVPKELATCRGWFFDPRTTWGCLQTLANYITVTRSVGRRARSEQPKQLTLVCVEETIQTWLAEGAPDDYGLGAALEFLRGRLAVAKTAFRFGEMYRNHYPNPSVPAQGEARRVFAGDLLRIAKEAITALEAKMAEFEGTLVAETSPANVSTEADAPRPGYLF